MLTATGTGFVLLTSILLCCQLIIGAPLVSRIGNEISKPSLSGVDVPGATFLQKDIILTEGVLFAYSAYYRSDKPVVFQIWRLVNTNGTESDTYRLIAQTRVLPAVVGGREDTYIESRLNSEMCVRVQTNDRLGVFLEESPGAVSYLFDPSTPTALNHRLPNGTTEYKTGDEYTFDALVFPYDFAVAAYIDIDPTHYNFTEDDGDYVDCFPGVLIPDYVHLEPLSTTTTAPPTGAPGATGATGPAGATGERGVKGEKGEPGIQGERGPTGSKGATGATGPAGKDGVDGTPGEMGATGSTGARGPKGEKGDTGPAGPRGPAGPAGKIIYVNNSSGDPLNTIRSSDPKSTSVFSSDTMSLSYLIWLVILTVFVISLIIVIIVITVRRRRRQEESGGFERTRFPSIYNSQEPFPTTTTDMEKAPSGGVNGWIDSMKDETETTYSNDTLDRDPDFSNSNAVLTASDTGAKASELGY